MERWLGIILSCALSMACLACGTMGARPSTISSDAFEQRRVIVFTVYWDFSSAKNLLATPIVIYNNGHFREPPCTHDEPEAAEFIQKYLTRGRSLLVLRGGRVIGATKITASALPVKDSCSGMVVPVETSVEIENTIGEWRQEVLAITDLPPEKQGSSPQPASKLLAEEAKRVVRNSLLGNGAPEKDVNKMKTEAWTADLNADGTVDLIVTSKAYFEELINEGDFYSVFLIAQKKEDSYEPVFVEYRRTSSEQESQFCSTHFIDTLNLSLSFPVSQVFVQYRCYEGVAYGVYDADGTRRYSGAYYGL